MSVLFVFVYLASNDYSFQILLCWMYTRSYAHTFTFIVVLLLLFLDGKLFGVTSWMHVHAGRTVEIQNKIKNVKSSLNFREQACAADWESKRMKNHRYTYLNKTGFHFAYSIHSTFKMVNIYDFIANARNETKTLLNCVYSINLVRIYHTTTSIDVSRSHACHTQE